jgi:hypothetical protein
MVCSFLFLSRLPFGFFFITSSGPSDSWTGYESWFGAGFVTFNGDGKIESFGGPSESWVETRTQKKLRLMGSTYL